MKRRRKIRGVEVVHVSVEEGQGGKIRQAIIHLWNRNSNFQPNTVLFCPTINILNHYYWLILKLGYRLKL